MKPGLFRKIGLFTTLLALAGSTAMAADSQKTIYNYGENYGGERREKSQWGFQLEGSAALMGNQAISDGPISSTMHTAGIMAEFQPRALQGFGVPSFGITAFGYPGASPKGSLNQDLLFGYSAGVQVRYQARFSSEQFIVPTISYSLNYFGYNTRTNGTGGFLAQAPAGGLWFCLNKIDQETADRFYKDEGIARTYLTAEARELVGGDSSLVMSGLS
jgi:hypothetical protein